LGSEKNIGLINVLDPKKPPGSPESALLLKLIVKLLLVPEVLSVDERFIQLLVVVNG
jgi:hypothetical protein